jgi:hypothetical protein
MNPTNEQPGAGSGGEFSAGVEAAAKRVDAMRFDFEAEYGRQCQETGAIEFGRGRTGEAREEYANSLAEVAEKIRAIATPPAAEGWVMVPRELTERDLQAMADAADGRWGGAPILSLLRKSWNALAARYQAKPTPTPSARRWGEDEVERVAKVIYEAEHPSLFPWERATDAARRGALNLARAALAAAPVAQQGEPVLWQVRWMRGNGQMREWSNCDNEAKARSLIAGDPSGEIRALYATPTAQPSEIEGDGQEGGFYLASFKRGTDHGNVLWWGPDNRGYSSDLEQAGIYTKIEAGYHDNEYTVPVPVAMIETLRVRRVVDYSDSLNTAFHTAAKLREAVAAFATGAPDHHRATAPAPVDREPTSPRNSGATIPLASPLSIAAQTLLTNALTFWKEARALNPGFGAVRWLTGNTGELLIFTRMEYRGHLLQNIDTLPGDVERFFEVLQCAECEFEEGTCVTCGTPDPYDPNCKHTFVDSAKSSTCSKCGCTIPF